MKTLFITLMLALCVACGDNNTVKVGEMTTMEVDDIFDAGTVVKGEVVKASFTIKNTGDAPLVISEVRPSCSCTVADKPTEPIAPGKSTTIVAKVETANVNAKSITKSVTLVTNSEGSTKVLLIKAKIK
jgi:hypothetical protein